MSVKQNPQLLIEAIIRSRIYESTYWKEQCFILNAEYLVDKAVNLSHIGGVHGKITPTDFLCLILKLLQLQPEQEIILAFINQTEFKYLRALGAFYYRLTANSKSVFKTLEPLLNDKRKLILRRTNDYALTFMDEFIDLLLHEERVLDVILPRLTLRFVLEELGELEPRSSVLEEGLEQQIVNANKDVLVKKHHSLFKKKGEKIDKVVKVVESSNQAQESMSIEDTNKMRIALGMKPLK